MSEGEKSRKWRLAIWLQKRKLSNSTNSTHTQHSIVYRRILHSLHCLTHSQAVFILFTAWMTDFASKLFSAAVAAPMSQPRCPLLWHRHTDGATGCVLPSCVLWSARRDRCSVRRAPAARIAHTARTSGVESREAEGQRSRGGQR